VFPYLLFTSLYLSLGFMIFNAIIAIVIFTYYVSVTRDISFKDRFLEMALISLGIAALTFAIGFLIRTFLGIDV
jgi:VIT1/CCC1 family predicted Fe2+/Mn2+ transporter